MFQFAALVGASIDTGFNFGVSKRESYYDVNYKCYNRSIFDGFDIDCNIISENKKFNYEYNEPHFHYSSDIKNIKDNTNLTGYYQSEKYFDHCKKEILDYFSFKTKVKAKGLENFMEEEEDTVADKGYN